MKQGALIFLLCGTTAGLASAKGRYMTRMPLNRRRLGRTNIDVTELGLGCYMFTGDFGVPQAEASAIMDAAFAAGINYADTAQMYGYGEGEELLGRALARCPDRQVHVSTKVGWLDRGIVKYLGDAAYKDEDALMRTIKHSLWLLRRESIELMIVHEPNLANWWGDGLLTGDAPVLNVLRELKSEGIVGAIGLGSWDCHNTADLIETGIYDVALLAGGYTLVGQEARKRVIPAAKKHDVGVVIGGAFLQGLLATIQRERLTALLATRTFEGRLDEPTINRLLAVYDLCDQTGLAITEMALRYIIADPDISTVIAGAQTVGQLHENVEAVSKGPLSADLLAEIEQICAPAVQ